MSKWGSKYFYDNCFKTIKFILDNLLKLFNSKSEKCFLKLKNKFSTVLNIKFHFMALLA